MHYVKSNKLYEWAELFLPCLFIWSPRLLSGYFRKSGLIAITLVVPLKDIIDISFRWGIQAKSDGKCSGLGIVLNKKFSQCTIIGTLHKLRHDMKYCNVKSSIEIRFIYRFSILLFFAFAKLQLILRQNVQAVTEQPKTCHYLFITFSFRVKNYLCHK